SAGELHLRCRGGQDGEKQGKSDVVDQAAGCASNPSEFRNDIRFPALCLLLPSTGKALNATHAVGTLKLQPRGQKISHIPHHPNSEPEQDSQVWSQVTNQIQSVSASLDHYPANVYSKI
ncbi:vacuolar amino acid transporter 5, partial [Moniliophthora roreri]